MSYWAEDESGSHWQGHYEGAAQEQATSGDYKHGNGYYKNGGYENRGYENGGYENGGSGGYYDSGGSYENGYGGLRGRRGGRGSKRWAGTLAFLHSMFTVGRGQLASRRETALAQQSSQSDSWSRGLPLKTLALSVPGSYFQGELRH